MSVQLPSSPLSRLWNALSDDVEALRDRQLCRTLSTIEAIDGTAVRINGQWLTSWCANDYLGLSTHPRVIEAACAAARQWGTGARASRLLTGNTAVHAQLETQLAAFFRAEAALMFSSGYLANLGVLTALLGPGDVVLVDRLAHASLIEACRASRATLRVFSHHHVDQVAELLARYPATRRRMVVTEGLFSMEGDVSPLSELHAVAQAHEALLYVDDAHGAFALGPTGRGSPEVAGIAHDSLLYMGTLGKALGCQGGFVVGPQILIQFLLNRARPFIYSTALAPPIVAAALAALELVQRDPAPRLRLAQNVQRLRARLLALGEFHVAAAHQILPLVVGSSDRACELAGRLRQAGMFVPAIRPPTVPEGTARLRLSVSALHTDQHVDRLAEALSVLLPAT